MAIDKTKIPINLQNIEDFKGDCDGAYVTGKKQQGMSDNEKVQALNNIQGKDYDAESFSGLGKKILSKNIVQLRSGNAKNVLDQSFFEDGEGNPLTNTVFVIQYDYDLDGGTIEIPDGCTLKFDGGSIKNGKIRSDGFFIVSDLYQIFYDIEFNALSDNNLLAIDNIYVKTLVSTGYFNRKTNSIVDVNSTVNRRYTWKITGTSTSPTTSGSAVNVTIGSTTYRVATVDSDGHYVLCFNPALAVGVDGSGNMVTGTVENLSGIIFFAVSPLTYTYNTKVLNKEIHPEWFGAKGDNVNDDSIAFNSALDLAYYADAIVRIGGGQYKLNDTLVINTHTNLIGDAPITDNNTKGCFCVSTDMGMVVFDNSNPRGGYNLKNIGFRPSSDANKHNYIGIKIYHSQNPSEICNVGFYHPNVGIDIEAIGGVQALRIKNYNIWSEEGNGIPETIAVRGSKKLAGWYNSNYFRPGFCAYCYVVKFEGGGNNVLDGGSCETNSYLYPVISLDKQATLIVKSCLYRETGKIAVIRNSSILKFEGDSYFYGILDCDDSSYIKYFSPNIQSRRSIMSNSYISNDVVLAHYKLFPKNVKLWYETISKSIVKPTFSDIGSYQTIKANGRLYAKRGGALLPMGGIDINGKTIAFRVLSPAGYTPPTGNNRHYPLYLNISESNAIMLSQGGSEGNPNISILYMPNEVRVCAIEKGEQFVFLPSQTASYVLNTIRFYQNDYLLISDIYILDKSSDKITGIEELKIIDALNNMDGYVSYGDSLLGYNKGATTDRPTGMTSADEGFEYFDTTLHKPVYWNGSGWVDATGVSA